MNMLYVYALFSFAIVAYMVILLYKISKTSAENKKFLSAPIFVAVIAVSSYTLFLLSSSYFPAIVLNEIYYICTDWLTFTLFLLFSEKTEVFTSQKRISKIFLAGSLADSVSLAVNTFTKHSFDIIPSMTIRGFRFWWLDFSPVHYVHLGFCYLMAVCAFVILVVNAFTAPKFYKKKYIAYLAAYIVVLICNFHSYSMNLPVDYSVILYGIFATFLALYSTKTFPSLLVTNVMEKVSESVPDAIVHFDYEGKIIYQNEAAKKLFDLKSGILKMSPAELKDKYLTNDNGEISVKWENGSVTFTTDLNFNDGNKENQNEASGTKNFRIIYQELKIEDTIVGSYIKVSDKTEEKTRYQKEKYAATHDELTGLLNRAGFFEEVETQLKKGTFKEPIMICSNIRDFKIVNDIFGETVGDEILLRHAQILKERSQENDINGRLGDDKFAIFMEKEHFKSDSFEKEFKELSHITKNNSYQMFISAGVYEVHDKTENAQVMYDKAKVAMDTIRENYLTTLAFYDSALMDKLLAEKNIINNFEKAISSNEFEMYVQPIVDKNGKVISAEALARWNSPEIGLIYPKDFIDILEHTGLVYKLDKLICEKAVSTLAKWKQKGYRIESIAINAASRDEYYFDTISFLTSTAEKYGIPHGSLIVEIRESALLNDYETGKHYFDKLKKAGFKVTIDDFGSGYSSLNMLKDFSVDAVKISADFFSGKEFSSRTQIILSSMLEMVKDLNIEAAALGIENESQKELLAGMGCSAFQGFLFSKPIPADEFEEKFLK